MRIRHLVVAVAALSTAALMPAAAHAAPVLLATTTTVQSTSLTPGQSDRPYFNANVVDVKTGRPAPTGTVTFYVNGRAEQTMDIDDNGNAAWPLDLKPDSNAVRAVYSGDSTHHSSNGVLTVTAGPLYVVGFRTFETIGATDMYGYYDATLKVVVYGPVGKGTPTGTIAGGGVACGTPKTVRTTLVVTCTGHVPPGGYPVFLIYSGDSTFAGFEDVVGV